MKFLAFLIFFSLMVCSSPLGVFCLLHKPRPVWKQQLLSNSPRNGQKSLIVYILVFQWKSLPGFFWMICPHALRALKGDHLSPKSDISPQKCSLFPRKDHQPHLFNIFTLKYDLRTFVETMSHLRTSMGQIAQDAWIGGWGFGGVNLI